MSHKKSSLIIFFGCFIFLSLYYIILNSFNLTLGSTITGDYWAQHVPILEIIRANFFDNFDFFPELIQLGNVQNYAYTFYYGSLSPFTLISFLFPFIDSVHWMQVQQILIFSFSLTLMNIFLIKFEKKPINRTIIVLLTTFAIGSIQSSANNVMFIYPLPFILLGLIGLQYRNKYLTIISTALIFSVNFMVAHIMFLILLIYYLIYEFKSFKYFLRDLILNFFIGSMIAMPIILTQLNIILSGSRTLDSNYSYPLFNTDFMDLLTSNHLDFGMPLIGLLCFVSIFFLKRRKDIILCFILFLLFILNPLNYFLNAGDYVMYRQSMLYVPFFSIILVAYLNINSFKIKVLLLLITIFYTFYYILFKEYDSIFKNSFNLGIYINFIILIFAVFSILFYILQYKKISLFFSLLYISSLFFFTNSVVNESFKYKTSDISECINNEYEIVAKSSQNNYRNSLPNNINSLCNITPSVYLSLSNNYLKDVYINMYSLPQYSSSTRNVYTPDKLHNKLLGISKIENEEYIEERNQPFIYTNDKVLDSKIQNSKSKLNFSYELLSNDFTSKSSRIDELSSPQIENKPINKEYIIEENLKKNVPVNYGDGVLGINISMNEQNCDLNTIKIESIINTKSRCDYMYFNDNYDLTYWIDSEFLKDGLDYEISKGKYNINNIEYVFISDNDIYDSKSHIKPINNLNILSNDKFEFEVDSDKPTYVVTSIPYDKGFKIKVNKKFVETEIINGGFLGFKVESGISKVEVNYNIAYFRLGIFLSFTTLFIFISVNFIKTKRNNSIK